MKRFLPALVFGGLIITIILQGILFASTGLQTNRLQLQLSEVSQKLNLLQNTIDTSLSLIPQTKNDSVLGIINSQDTVENSVPNDLLTPEKLSLTLDTPVSSAVKLKPNNNNIDVYEATRTSSHVTGQLITGIDYPIITKQTGWYLIKLDTQTNAWVQAQFVNETN